jgi:hypothetical protein
MWLEAAVIAGILARTQGLAKEARRKFLNDMLLFLMAAESGAILISRNSRDIDLLLQMKVGVGRFAWPLTKADTGAARRAIAPGLSDVGPCQAWSTAQNTTERRVKRWAGFP